MKTYEITFDNGKVRILTVFDESTDIATEIQKSIPLDSELTGALITTIIEKE